MNPNPIPIEDTIVPGCPRATCTLHRSHQLSRVLLNRVLLNRVLQDKFDHRPKPNTWGEP
jgi:hypothetical protein